MAQRVFPRVVVCSVLAAAWVAASPVAGASSIQTIEPGKLKVCLYAGFAPFASKDVDGHWQGWDVTYLMEFAQENHLDFQIIEENFDNIWQLPGKDNPVCDIAGTGISNTTERRGTSPGVTWSDTYYGVVRTFLVRTEQFANLTKAADLHGKIVIVTKGSTANTDICYRLAAEGVHVCERPHDQPCNFPGKKPKITSWASDPQCVTIEYPFDNEEKNAATAVAHSSDYSTFAYGGGYGSVQALVCDWSETQALATVWPHCNMSADGRAYAEPFSFVARTADKGLSDALNCFIYNHKYPGTPIPDLGCEAPKDTHAPGPQSCKSK